MIYIDSWEHIYFWFRKKCECTDNMSKEKSVCTIYAVLISLYVNSRLNGFHKLIIFMIIVLMNAQGNIFKEKQFLKACPRVA